MNQSEEQINILNSIKMVLQMEAQAIMDVETSLDENNVALIELCQSCKGKLVLTGMGKSGHVAKKISTTLASLGTPSFFLHPAEAAHGDLGMVSKSDVLIMFSKSGQTDELLRIIPSLKVIGCPVVGVFCRKDSILERYCDLTIVLPVEKEACANNLAPTSSTTVTMAWGDALAITLSKLLHFEPKNFALYHPLGSLGKRLLTTAEMLMRQNSDNISVHIDAPIEKVLWMITSNHMGAVAVIDNDGRLVGLITDGDIRRALDHNADILKRSAVEVMTEHPIVIRKTMMAVDMINLMKEKRISIVPVIEEDGHLAGMITMHDALESGIIS